jgi:cysteine synthase A
MPIISGSERDKLYKRLSTCVGNTTLYKIRNITVPNGCKIFCKEEYLNPTGSHYDRFWVDYLRRQEDQEYLSTTDTLIETSTGNSGASFAWACRALGFSEYHVVIPEDMPFVRIQQILDYGAKIKMSPANEYVAGLIRTFNKYFKEIQSHTDAPDTVVRPNHSRFGTMSLGSLAKIAEESIRQLNSYGEKKFDYFITALGNGLSTRSIGERLKKEYPQIKLIGIEAAQSPTVYAKNNKDIKLPDTTGKTHGLLGTSPGVDTSIFPIMDDYSSSLDVVDLIEEKDWDAGVIQLADYEGKLIGHSSAASFHKAMQVASSVSNKNILIIFYDPAWKYLRGR